MKKFLRNITITRSVGIPGLIVILGISGICGFFPEWSSHILTLFKSFIFAKLSWIYVFLFTFFILFLLGIAFSKLSAIKLGTDYSKPEYSFFSWISMLFAAGMGVGLMFFGVGETISHYNSPILMELGNAQRARQAQLFTFFHWGIHAWSAYAVVALALAYFRFRYKLPLSIRSAFYPLLKNRIYGWPGDLIDVFALCSTFFGIATTLGMGVIQLNSGLKSIGFLEDTGFGYQVAIIILVMAVAVGSTMSGLEKGIKKLSELNMMLALALMLFVLFSGPTSYILRAFSEGLGTYISHLPSLTFNTYAYEPDKQSWLSNWTILYWAWWISWSPFVGLFIARISKGRTIREFIVAVLLIPSIFNFLWMTIFGGSAIWLDNGEANGTLRALVGNLESMLFHFFAYFPFTRLLNLLAVLMITIFFVTSADSGILVMNSIASHTKRKPNKWQNLFWGLLMSLLCIALLRSGGLGSLQALTLIAALPFGLIMLMLCYCLWHALRTDQAFHESGFAHGSVAWYDKNWRDRLKRVLSFPRLKDIREFISNDVAAAFTELKTEFEKNGIEATINQGKNEQGLFIELIIPYDRLRNFKYGVAPEPQKVSEYLLDEENAPNIEVEKTYIPLTYFNDGRRGNDIQYMTKEEIVADVLMEYERFISLVSNKATELLTIDQINPPRGKEESR